MLPGARKFREMGVSARKDIEELRPVEATPRKVAPSDEDTAQSPPTLRVEDGRKGE